MWVRVALFGDAVGDDQSQEAKRVFSRLMENYTGYLEHPDSQIGRVIDAVAPH